MKTPFIWLGAGRAKKRGVERRGRLLDNVARAGLPVPDGGILLDEMFRIFLNEGVIEQAGSDLIVPDPVWLLQVLYRDVGFPRLRAAADICTILPDGDDRPIFQSSGVDLEDAEESAAALCRAWSYLDQTPEFRRDVLVMKQIQAQVKGRALSPADGVEDRLFSPLGDSVETVTVPRLKRWQRPSAEFPSYVGRLQQLLRGMRRTLGEGDWDFNWADDGEICWIVSFN
jgi:hypothetical protein